MSFRLAKHKKKILQHLITLKVINITFSTQTNYTPHVNLMNKKKMYLNNNKCKIQIESQ